ncbi:MAG: hypothetical protein HFG36_01160 [Eubacterium sp.]|nr:hypothetical protein [Eubacterium sp.]
MDYVYELSKIAFLEYIVNGITACFDMYYEPHSMSRLSEEYDFRTVLCGAINNFRETPETIEEAFLHYNKMHQFISYRLGVHAEYTTRTDGPASNNGLDMFKEMYLVSTLQKLITNDASACRSK